MSGLSLAGSGLTLEQSSGGGSASNGFPIGPGSSGVVSSGGSIIILSGGSETISGTETIASGGSLIVAAGGSETISGTETIASGGVLTVASGGALGVAGTGTISSGASLLIASGGSETVQSGATLGIASGGAEIVSPGGSLTVSSGAVLSVTSGATISSGTAQTLETALGSAGLSPLTPGFATGRWYPPPFVLPNSAVGVALVSGTIYGSLFYVPYATSFAALGAWVVTSATGNLLFGAYGPLTAAHMSAAFSGAPKLGQTASAAIGGAGTGVSAAFTSAILPGWYVGCVMADATPGLGRGISNTVAFGEYLFGQATLAAGVTVNVGVTAAGITFGNGLPSVLPTMTAASAPAIPVVSWMK